MYPELLRTKSMCTPDQLVDGVVPATREVNLGDKCSVSRAEACDGPKFSVPVRQSSLRKDRRPGGRRASCEGQQFGCDDPTTEKSASTALGRRRDTKDSARNRRRRSIARVDHLSLIRVLPTGGSRRSARVDLVP